MRRKYEIKGVRFLFAVATFFCLITNYAIRVNLNVAIVAMVNSSAVYNHHNRSTSHECVPSSNTSNIENQSKEVHRVKDGEFTWSPGTQGIILGAFYYGYCSFQIVAGRLSDIYSGKWVFATGTFIASLLGLLIPVAARYSVAALVFIRALQGVFQGVMFPSLISMSSHWLPDSERGIFSSFIHSGVNFGVVIGMTGTGYLCNSNLFGGWPSVFYVFDSVNCLVIIVWCILVTNSPQNHPFISKSELKYIVSRQATEMNKYIPPIAWRKIITSVPVWALIIMSVGIDWSFFILLNELPTFFATVLHFDIKKNGFFSSAPFMLQAVVAVLCGYVTDSLIRRNLATVNFIRKGCTTFACIAVAVGLTGVCLSGCNATLCVIFLMCSIPVIGMTCSGHNISHLDLAPEYAGTLVGITNSFGSLMGFTAPMFVGFMTDEHQSLQEWHTVFITAIVVAILSCIVFLMFGSTKKQNWIDKEEERTALVESPNSYSILKQ